MEKVISEKSPMTVGDYDPKRTTALLPFPEIEKHLAEGWTIKQMFVNTYGPNGISAPTDLVITVHLQKD
jgi:hypothetical protein